MLKGLFLLGPWAYDQIYGEPERAAIADLVNIVAPQQTAESVRENPGVLTDVDVIFSGWGKVMA